MDENGVVKILIEDDDSIYPSIYSICVNLNLKLSIIE